MDNRQEHLNNLNEIRSIMERSSSFLSLSGLSGVSAGIIGLISAYILYIKVSPYMNYRGTITFTAGQRQELIIFGIIFSAVVLLLTFAAAIFFTARKAKKKGLPVWDGSAKRLVSILFIPLAAGGIFCLLLIHNMYDWLVMPSMLIFYGLALLNAGKFTHSEIKWLGISEILLGFIAMVYMPNGVLFWGLGFGVMNIIYGLVMYFRHER